MFNGLYYQDPPEDEKESVVSQHHSEYDDYGEHLQDPPTEKLSKDIITSIQTLTISPDEILIFRYSFSWDTDTIRTIQQAIQKMIVKALGKEVLDRVWMLPDSINIEKTKMESNTSHPCYPEVKTPSGD